MRKCFAAKVSTLLVLKVCGAWGSVTVALCRGPSVRSERAAPGEPLTLSGAARGLVPTNAGYRPNGSRECGDAWHHRRPYFRFLLPHSGQTLLHSDLGQRRPFGLARSLT